MFGRIIFISESVAHIENTLKNNETMDFMNIHVIFEAPNQRILGEIAEINPEVIKIRFLGEYVNGRYVNGVIRKPLLSSHIRIINESELKELIGSKTEKSFELGHSAIYKNYTVYPKINSFFSNHFFICGNSGAGKTHGISRIIQNVFMDKSIVNENANLFLFDAYGEYHNALQTINRINPNLNFKFYTTNFTQTDGEVLSIPLWLMDVDDMALLLRADKHSQLTIIERMLKLVNIFCAKDDISIKYQNHLIAKAIMSILYTNQTSSSKRNDVFRIIANCSTEQFNLEAPVHGIGYTRKFRECFTIDTAGQFPESNLMTEYITSFIDENLDTYEPTNIEYYTLEDLERALEFTLISEGLLNNSETYSDAITLKVRLHSLTISENSRYLRYPNYITAEDYIASLVSLNGHKAQVINFNLEDIDDWFAKVVVKLYSKLLFDFTKKLKERASIPFHIFVEEAHRYIQNDGDVALIGYNIFERIAKEGRKYGVILNLISQRPVEISETVISQCANFLIFKLNHPRDVDYIKKMLPNISAEIVEKQKTLQPGTCMAFGKAFKVPTIVRMQMPDPEPSSSSCDVVDTWQVKGA